MAERVLQIRHEHSTEIKLTTILLWIIYLTNLGSALFHSKTCQHSILISYYNLVVSM